MRKIQKFFRSRAGQITLGAISVVTLAASALFLVRLFNPPVENPVNAFTGVSTNTTATDGENVEIDTATFPQEWLQGVGDVAYAPNGDAYFTNQNLHQIFVLRDGTAEVFAGTGEEGWRDGDREQTKFSAPTALTIDKNGNLYVADTGNHRIRIINIESGSTITFAGSGDTNQGLGAYLDGGRDLAKFNSPGGIAIAPNGNIFVADTENNAIRMVTSEGVRTIAGNPEAGFNDGPGELARFNRPQGIAFLNDTTLLIADSRNDRIRSLNIATGQVETYAGNGRIAITDGPRLNASFQYPSDITIAPGGSIFVADTLNHVIRVIPTDERVYTLAGTGEEGFADGPLSQAKFSYPVRIAESPTGALLVVDLGNQTIRQLR